MGNALNRTVAWRLFNYAGFQAGWLILVLTRSPWSLLWALVFVACHWRWLASAAEWRRVIPIMVFGGAIDALWQASPWVEFYGAGWPLPLWLIGLWLMFPLTLNHSLAWLADRPILQIFGGIVGAGGSYLGGATLGAAQLSGPAWYLLPLSWGLWLPLFYRWMSVTTSNSRGNRL
ncbi:DUF2878 domain-containing protein [Saccharospirillum mangrovi]|uniref:DUF2878 domain-containing protein n=1 Tax=Saccharospirillum mangrovi TaxID=2161747 RepID=UPI001300567E|nr:DUF2878 domain-containing protein [Saccharospirillum mangrovi]